MIKEYPTLYHFCILFGLLLFPGFFYSSIAQEKKDFFKKDRAVIHMNAMKRLAEYQDIINQIGESVVNNPALSKGLSDQFLELFVSRQVLIYNDLDPDHNLSPFYEVESYINNLLLWYPDGIIIDLQLKTATASEIYAHSNNVYFLDFRVEKQITGNYMNKMMNTNVEPLLIRIAFNQNNEEFRNFRIVGIRSAESNLKLVDESLLEEVNNTELRESDIITVNQGIESIARDYENYVLLLASTMESEEDKGYFRQSFKALFESPEVSVFNDLQPEPESYLVSLDEYLNILRVHYPQGINNLSILLDSTLFENVINEGNNIYSIIIHPEKFFSGVYDGDNIFRNNFPLTIRISFRKRGRTYEEFRIRSIDMEAEDYFETTISLPEPGQKIKPVSRKGLSLSFFGSYGQTHIEDHNLIKMNIIDDHHTWSLIPEYGVAGGLALMISMTDHLAFEIGAYYNQYVSTYSISGTYEDRNPSYDVNNDYFLKYFELDYDSTLTYTLISIPLSFTITSSNPGKVGVYLSVGAIYTYSFYEDYRASGLWSYFGHYPDNPTAIEYLDLNQLGYYSRANIEEEGRITKSGNYCFSLKGSFGLSIPLGYFTQLRFGPEIEYGITDFNMTTNEYKDIFGYQKELSPTYLLKLGVNAAIIFKL